MAHSTLLCDFRPLEMHRSAMTLASDMVSFRICWPGTSSEDCSMFLVFQIRAGEVRRQTAPVRSPRTRRTQNERSFDASQVLIDSHLLGSHANSRVHEHQTRRTHHCCEETRLHTMGTKDQRGTRGASDNSSGSGTRAGRSQQATHFRAVDWALILEVQAQIRKRFR